MFALIHKLLKCRCTHLQITSDSDDGGTCTGGMGGGGRGTRSEHTQASVHSLIQWNLDLTTCQGTGEICSLSRGLVTSKTSI